MLDIVRGGASAPLPPVDRLAKLLEAVNDAVYELVNENRDLRRKLADQAAEPSNKKLTQPEVRMIRDMHRSGHSMSELADIFQVHRTTVSRAVHGVYHRGVK